MSKTLVLAEKPSVGRELARVLGCGQKREGYFEGKDYCVTWALGHLVTLAEPEAYGKEYEKWDLATLPMLPKKMQLVVIPQTAKQYHVVQKLLKAPEIEKIVIATDAGREGELVARWILEKAACRKPLKRLWISSQTDKAIKEGFAKLKDGREYENLYASAQSRAEADWLVGMNVTRALTCRFNAQLSAGRVQTPTLAMICRREEEIKQFVPTAYYGLQIQAQGVRFTWKSRKTNSPRISQQETAQRLAAQLKGSRLKITQLKKERKLEPAPLLYDLTELQRDANKKYGFTAKETLNLMQRLYENHKLLTYPRTDSRYLSADIVPTLAERLKAVSVAAYAPFAKEILRKGIQISKRIVDDSKVTDHHAIIPTEQYVDLMELTNEERRIYDLVVRRFLAVLSPAYAYDSTKITAEAGGELFTAAGQAVAEAGWRRLYQGMTQWDDDEEESQEEPPQQLPQWKQGQELAADAIKITEGKTKPPARYTEATLLSAMENPAKFVEDRQLKSVLDSVSGIGTPATRADIIEKLFSANYVERRGKEIFPLSKGMQLVKIVPEDLKSPALTAQWEQQLTAISKGQRKPADFRQEMCGYATKLVQAVKMSSAEYHHDNVTRTRCPLCDKFLLEVNGKRGKMLVCPDRECGYRQNLSFTSNARCPRCHKKLEIVGEGEKKIYSCKCGFREKFDRFNEYLKENSAGASRSQVRQYLQRQQEQEERVSPFAAALAKAQEKQQKK